MGLPPLGGSPLACSCGHNRPKSALGDCYPTGQCYSVPATPEPGPLWVGSWMINNTITWDSTPSICLFPLTPKAKFLRQSKILVLTKSPQVHILLDICPR